jgi:hypothetical protein
MAGHCPSMAQSLEMAPERIVARSHRRPLRFTVAGFNISFRLFV